MTRIFLIQHNGFFGFSWIDDPRPPRDLVMLINTGSLRLGETFFMDLEMQSACSIPEVGVVVVTDEAPLVRLTPRMYQVLWNIADGKSAHQLANSLQIRTYTVYQHYARLKERFSAGTLAEVVVQAQMLGYL